MKKLHILLTLIIFLSYCTTPPPPQPPPKVTGVDKPKEREMVQVIMDSVNKPKILVIPKSIDSYDDYTEIAINEMNKRLGELGFYYVSINAVMDFMQKMNNYGGNQSYLDIASKSNTPYYIVMSLKQHIQGKGVDGAFFSAVTINADAFQTEIGQGVSSSVKNSGSVGSSSTQEESIIIASQKAGRMVIDDLINSILLHWKEQSKRGFQFDIRIYGITDYLVAREFKDALTNYKGFIGDIRMTKNDDHYRFEITFKDKRADLVVDAIFDALVGKQNFRTMDTGNITGNKIDLNIK